MQLGPWYAACAEETMNQLNNMRLDIDHIIVPSGSAGTHAGMVTGMVGINMNIPITGINVSQSKKEKEEKVYNLAIETAERFAIKSSIARSSVVCFDDYVGEGYSIPPDSMVEAVKLFARTKGILLDPVYSGKIAAELIDLIRRNHFSEGANVYFFSILEVLQLYLFIWTLSGNV